MRQDLTEKYIQKLKHSPPKDGYILIYDTSKGSTSGFGLRLTASGCASFFLEYRFKGRKKRMTIGQYPAWSAEAARAEARDRRVQIDKGTDPLEKREAERCERLVSDLATDYLERYAKVKRPKSVPRATELLKGRILPSKIGSLRVSAVTRRDIELLHQSMSDVPYRANRVLALLSKMFSLAMEWGWRPDNPVKHVERFPEVPRHVWLDEKQLEALTRALDDYADQNAADALRLLILTGSRSGEVLNAEWPAFDLRRGVWTKDAHTVKQAKTEHVPLNKAALQILDRMAKCKKGLHLFPGAAGTPIGILAHPRTTLRRAWISVCRTAGLATQYMIPGKRHELVRYRPMFRIHDLRHSFASHLVSRRQSLHVVGSLLGHTRPETMMRYAHLADSARREAAEVFPWPSSSAATKKRTRSASA